MNNSFSLQQISKTGNLESNLISCQFKLNLIANFMLIKFEKPRIKQSEKADQLGYSSSTLQGYRNDINMHTPYRIQPNITDKRSKKVSSINLHIISHREHDLKRAQMTSKNTNENGEKVKSKNILRADDPKDHNPIKGRDLFEQAFSSQ